VNLAYMPIYLLCFLAIFLLNIVLLPAAYGLNLCVLCFRWRTKKFPFLLIVKWAFLGLFILIKSLFVDAKQFNNYLFNESYESQNDLCNPFASVSITDEQFSLLKYLLKEIYQGEILQMTVSEFFSFILEYLRLSDPKKISAEMRNIIEVQRYNFNIIKIRKNSRVLVNMHQQLKL